RGSGSSSQTLSRPSRELPAKPTFSSTWRCFVTACRVTWPPSVRRAIDIGQSTDKRATRRRRVWSPRAAKIKAVFFSPRRALGLGCLADIALDRFHLRSPTLVVAAIRVKAASQRNSVETRFDDAEQGAVGGLLEFED